MALHQELEVEPNALESRLLGSDDDEVYTYWFNKYFLFVKRAKYWIVGVWFVLTIWGLCTGFEYIKEARDSMEAPAGSRAAKDEAVFKREFPEQAAAGQLILYLACKDEEGDCFVSCPSTACPKQCKSNPWAKSFSENVSRAILEYSDKHDVGYSHEVMGYYQMEGSLDMVKCQFTSRTGQQMFMVFTTSTKVSSKKRYDMVEEIVDHILPKYNTQPKVYFTGITGVDPMTRDGSVAAVSQSEKIDAVTMPFAFLLLGYMVRSWRLLLVALINMGIALLVSFGVLHLITLATDKPPMTTTATFVQVLGLAMSIDYSLFLGRRFRDESKNGRHPETAVKIMLNQAGHVVTMSALTIIFVFCGFIFMKSTDLKVQGIACSVIVAMCLFVNMTNTPALLLIFPHFFALFSHNKPGQQPKESSSFAETVSHGVNQASAVASDCYRRCLRCVRREDTEDSEEAEEDVDQLLTYDLNEDGTGDPSALQYLTSPTAEVITQRGGPYKGCYFKMLLFITEWPKNLICLVSLYVLVIPLAIQALNLQRNQNLLQAIPRNSAAANVYEEIYDHFGGGALMPMYVIVEAPQDHNDTILNDQFFDEVADLTTALAEGTNNTILTFNSVAYANGNAVSYGTAKSLLNNDSLICASAPDYCAAYQFQWKMGVNTRQTSILITVTVIDFDPFKGDIESFIDDIYDVLDNFPKSNTTIGLYLSGTQVGFVADMKVSFGEFPLLVTLTCIIVFSLLGIMLQSAFVVIRLTLTVILPLAGMFGLSVCVYQHAWLEWTGIRAFESSDEGFYWYVPLLCFTICCGLSLDYDIYVISRIRENRVAGYEIRAAIVKAMWEISSTIIAAGLIMTAAFSGLLLSDTLCVNQTSFILTATVVFDTFVVQILVVPAIMSLADHLSWWPGKVPEDNLVTLEEEIETRNTAFEAAMGGDTPNIDSSNGMNF